MQESDFLTEFLSGNMKERVPIRDPHIHGAALVYRRGTCPVLPSCRPQCRIRPVKNDSVNEQHSKIACS